MDFYDYNPNDYEDGQQAVAAGLFAIAHSIVMLGNNGANTSMGAIEALGGTLGDAIKDGFKGIENSLDVLSMKD